jgi:hypothetical protein
MKTRITENNLRVEMKGHEAYTIEDKNNYVLLTNNDFPVKIEFSDRRYFCVETSKELIKNKDYFDKFFDILEDEEIAKHFYYYLLNTNLTNFSTENMPETTLKTDIRVDSAPNPVKFAIDIVSDGLTYDEQGSLDAILNGETEDSVKVADTQKLYKCYKQFVMNKCPGEKMYVYEGFKRKFKELLNIDTNKIKTGDITIINRQSIINGIINYFNIKDISEIIKNSLLYDDGYYSH